VPKDFEGVMREWGAGKLHSGSKHGPKVKDQKQALAIAFSEDRKKHNSNPHETRESGDNMVSIADGGGPFQAFGPRAGDRNPGYGGCREDDGPDEFSAEPQKPWPEGPKSRTRPKRQISDDG
jgi:hypothetical protein